MRLGSASVLCCINAFDCSDSESRLRSPALGSADQRSTTYESPHHGAVFLRTAVVDVLEIASLGNNFGSAAAQRASLVGHSADRDKPKLTLLGPSYSTLSLIIGH
ncbi:hypothetical protein BJY00DRAFT_136773 [Aspergillus carlsbadensis]|nr:hypothetical protein BJY00DRAFT_136773 [Aspergillus carlsbadensis]